MSPFETFFTLGYKHILDLSAFDHLLFVIVLCAAASFKRWRSLLGLVTAFTIGHCLSLVATAYVDISSIQNLVEICIPLSIIASILLAFKSTDTTRFATHYLLILFFGLIHGMGFANYIKSLLFDQAGFLTHLFYFNLGIEAGQLVIVLLACIVARCLVYCFPRYEAFIIKSILIIALILSIYLLVGLF